MCRQFSAIVRNANARIELPAYGCPQLRWSGNSCPRMNPTPGNLTPSTGSVFTQRASRNRQRCRSHPFCYKHPRACVSRHKHPRRRKARHCNAVPPRGTRQYHAVDAVRASHFVRTQRRVFGHCALLRGACSERIRISAPLSGFVLFHISSHCWKCCSAGNFLVYCAMRGCDCFNPDITGAIVPHLSLHNSIGGNIQGDRFCVPEACEWQCHHHHSGSSRAPALAVLSKLARRFLTISYLAHFIVASTNAEAGWARITVLSS